MLKFGWRRRPLQPARVVAGLVGLLELQRDLLRAAADAYGDTRFGDVLDRIERALDALTK